MKSLDWLIITCIIMLIICIIVSIFIVVKLFRYKYINKVELDNNKIKDLCITLETGFCAIVAELLMLAVLLSAKSIF